MYMIHMIHMVLSDMVEADPFHCSRTPFYIVLKYRISSPPTPAVYHMYRVYHMYSVYHMYTVYSVYRTYRVYRMQHSPYL